MKFRAWSLAAVLALGILVAGCVDVEHPGNQDGAAAESRSVSNPQDFKWEAERFADLRVLRYQVPGFEELKLEEKKLIYCLYEAALCGREIIYDQKYRYNLPIKR